MGWGGAVKAIFIGKPIWKLSSVLVKTVNQKQKDILLGITEMSATVEDLKDVGAVASITPLFNSLFQPLQEPDSSRRMVVGND